MEDGRMVMDEVRPQEETNGSSLHASAWVEADSPQGCIPGRLRAPASEDEGDQMVVSVGGEGSGDLGTTLCHLSPISSSGG